MSVIDTTFYLVDHLAFYIIALFVHVSIESYTILICIDLNVDSIDNQTLISS